MKELLVRSSLGITMLLFFGACSEVTGPSGDALDRGLRLSDDDVMLHLVGEGNFNPSASPDLVLNALRTFKGDVGGNAVVPWDGGKIGTVVELVAPSTSYDHWCVNVLLDEVPDLLPPGFNALVYIQDTGDGQSSFDQIAFGGDFGTTCTAHPAPEDLGDFRSLTSGDFKGSVRTR